LEPAAVRDNLPDRSARQDLRTGQADNLILFWREVVQVAAAYVLINATPGRAGAARKHIADIPGVTSAHAVTGAYDIIAYVEGSDINELGNTVVSQIQASDGVAQTMTCVVVELP